MERVLELMAMWADRCNWADEDESYVRTLLDKAHAAGVAEERERCAALAEQLGATYEVAEPMGVPGRDEVKAYPFADAIRKGE